MDGSLSHHPGVVALTGELDAAASDQAILAAHLRATAQRQRAQVEQARILARLQQQAIDSEVRASRRRLLADLRTRLRTDAAALSSEDFLAVADSPAVLDAILVTAITIGAADACDLQLYEPHTATLRIARHRGFTREFLTYFAVVDARQPTSCAVAAATGEPVIIDDITSSAIFAGQPTLEIVLAAGTRAIHSHPLHDDAGRLLAVLSLHYRTARPRLGNSELVAWCAAQALSRTARR